MSLPKSCMSGFPPSATPRPDVESGIGLAGLSRLAHGVLGGPLLSLAELILRLLHLSLGLLQRLAGLLLGRGIRRRTSHVSSGLAKLLGGLVQRLGGLLPRFLRLRRIAG